MSTTAAPVRLGILGAARIARLLVEAVRPSQKVIVSAVASRDVARASAFASDLQIGRTHQSYEALLADPGHRRRLRAPAQQSPCAMGDSRSRDRRARLQKPLAASGAEARAIFDTARRHRVHIVEGYPFSRPATDAQVARVARCQRDRQCAPGPASFGFPLTDASNTHERGPCGRRADGRRVVPGELYPHGRGRAAGTGPCDGTLVRFRRRRHHARDAGICAWSARADLVHVRHGASSPRVHRRRCGIDPYDLLQRHGSDIPADARCQARHRIRDAQRDVEMVATSGFLAEAEAFHDLLRDGPGRWTGATPEESIDIALTLDALAASARSGSPAEVTG